MIIRQATLTIPPGSQGWRPITSEVIAAAPGLSGVRAGLLHLFLQHTSASLAINENADPDVPADLEDAFDRLAPENAPYRHTCEGPDDMPAHVKHALLGASLLIPVQQGRLALGTWQGIYLCEHRRRGGRRRIVLTLLGEPGEASS